MILKLRAAKLHIRTKIMLIYLLVFIPILLIIVFSVNAINNHYAMDITVKNNLLSLKNTSGQIDDNLKDMERISLLTVSDENIQTILDQYNHTYDYKFYQNQQWLKRFFLNAFSIRQNICSIRIVKGNDPVYQYNGYNYTFKTNYNYMDAAWVKVAQQGNGKPVILGTASTDDINYYKDTSPYYSLSYSIVRQIDRQLSFDPVGYIKIDTNLGVLDNLINQYKDRDSDIMICDRNSHVVYSADTDKIGELKDRNLPSEGSGEGDFYTSWHGRRCISTWLTSTYTGWTIYCLTPESEIMHNLHIVEYLEILIILFGIFLAIGLSILLSKFVTRNIVNLNNSMKQVQKGDFSIELAPSSQDEIGELTVTFNRMVKKIDDLIQREYITCIHNQQLKLNQKQAQLQVLLSQINPHFLYNTLDVIRITASLKGDKDVEKMLFALSVYFRMGLTDSGVKTTLAQELRHAEAYVAICKFRFRHLHYNTQIEIENTDDILAPRFILQPIVENAIHHGMETTESECMIALKITAQSDILQIRISDNGKGIDAEKCKRLNQMFHRPNASQPNEPEKGREGIGLGNVNARIQLLYGLPFGLTIQPNSGNGATVVVNLPVELSEGPDGPHAYPYLPTYQ